MSAFDAGTAVGGGHFNPIGVESEDIRRWVERKNPVATDHWRTLGREEHARAFAVARTTGQDIIDDLYFAFHDTVASGGTEIDFERAVMPMLKQKGWLADKGDAALATRVRLIYDTNLRLARASGKWSRYWSSRSALPYLRGVTGRDERVRHPPKSDSDHRAWEGIILPIDHPFWTRWFPPLGFRCRCNVIQMTRSQLARYPRGFTSEGELADREARLGEPIFSTPAQGISAQIAGMADATNEDLTPGSRVILPGVVQQQGENLWEAVVAAEAMRGLVLVLERIFG